MNLDEITFEKHPAGWRAYSNFPNGYGVSILPERNGEHYELAVLENGRLSCETEIAQDVLRWQTRDQVDALVDRIKELPPRTFSVRGMLQ
jgi:hypothetical protein